MMSALTQRRQVFSSLIRTAILVCISFSAHAQSVLIQSPANGAVIQPGQALQVTVKATETASMSLEVVLAEGIGASTIQSPADSRVFTLSVPSDIQPGNYAITAVGQSNGKNIFSTPVLVTVPISGAVTSLVANLRNLILNSPGEQANIDVDEVTNHGRAHLSTEQLSFNSRDEKIATVSANGAVTGQSPGKTQINITYGTGAAAISTGVHVTVGGGMRGDINGDGKVDMTDLKLLQASLNTPANGANDARDLNHDGKIDALDERILVTLCTHPGCAYK